MNLTIRTHGTVPRDAAQVATQRLRFALGRFADRVRSLTVRLSDVNGPRGGRDQRCAIEVRLAGSKRPIVIEDLDVVLPAAIARAAERAGRAVARAVRLDSQWSRVRLQPVE